MSDAASCWSCRGPIESGPLCPVCAVIQPPDPGLDFFALLALPRGFTVDRALLEERYRERQQQLHPDRFATRSAQERRYSLEHVTRLNEAYQTLGAPLLRAHYLIRLLGGAISSEGGGGVQPSDPAFLMEVMALREALEEVDPGADDALEALDRLRADVEGREAGEVAAIGQALDGALAVEEGERGALLETAARHADRLRYHQRFLEEVERLEEKMF